MSRVSVAERTRLSVFLARGLVRKLTSRVTTHPIVNWPFSFGKADRVVIAPQDLRTTDSTRAAEIYAERYSDPDGRIRATFSIIYVSGWAPHESQQKPLKPGSAKARLADALKVDEHKLSQ
jgi:hypothetical protein